MAAIKQRKTKYSVIYWYVNEQGERKQKWGTREQIMALREYMLKNQIRFGKVE